MSADDNDEEDTEASTVEEERHSRFLLRRRTFPISHRGPRVSHNALAETLPAWERATYASCEVRVSVIRVVPGNGTGGFNTEERTLSANEEFAITVSPHEHITLLKRIGECPLLVYRNLPGWALQVCFEDDKTRHTFSDLAQWKKVERISDDEIYYVPFFWATVVTPYGTIIQFMVQPTPNEAHA